MLNTKGEQILRLVGLVGSVWHRELQLCLGGASFSNRHTLPANFSPSDPFLSPSLSFEHFFPRIRVFAEHFFPPRSRPDAPATSAADALSPRGAGETRASTHLNFVCRRSVALCPRLQAEQVASLWIKDSWVFRGTRLHSGAETRGPGGDRGAKCLFSIIIMRQRCVLSPRLLPGDVTVNEPSHGRPALLHRLFLLDERPVNRAAMAALPSSLCVCSHLSWVASSECQRPARLRGPPTHRALPEESTQITFTV
ncbi:unnamed protein product [Pleuronectes platessa]|uniref:Uncharacterized protein n=1 Tax=Pleuronectes platessa TaxID=8262 RepID=A0A9N7TWR2_PLEPL|nr:unnamed protein product [Pleuronectes platessa]